MNIFFNSLPVNLPFLPQEAEKEKEKLEKDTRPEKLEKSKKYTEKKQDDQQGDKQSIDNVRKIILHFVIISIALQLSLLFCCFLPSI